MSVGLLPLRGVLRRRIGVSYLYIYIYILLLYNKLEQHSRVHESVANHDGIIVYNIVIYTYWKTCTRKFEPVNSGHIIKVYW